MYAPRPTGVRRPPVQPPRDEQLDRPQQAVVHPRPASSGSARALHATGRAAPTCSSRTSRRRRSTRSGIHETELLDRNPRLLVLRIPPAGLTGDWATYTGFGAPVRRAQRASPSSSATTTARWSRRPPRMYMDAATGPAGAFAVVAALHYRAATGRGQVIELAQMRERVEPARRRVRRRPARHRAPTRSATATPTSAPQGIYRVPRRRSRRLAITVDRRPEWAALARVIGRADLVDDPRFVDRGRPLRAPRRARRAHRRLDRRSRT